MTPPLRYALLGYAAAVLLAIAGGPSGPSIYGWLAFGLASLSAAVVVAEALLAREPEMKKK
jgi:hypothetical protein